MTAPADTPAPRPAEDRPWPGMDVAGLRILVTGFGVSGYAIADQPMHRGARVLVVAGADTPARGARAAPGQRLEPEDDHGQQRREHGEDESEDEHGGLRRGEV